MTPATPAELDDRLARLREQFPDLAPAAALQRTLIGRMIAVVGRLEQGVPRSPASTPGVVARLKQGLPALQDQAILIPTAALAPELAPLCDALAAGGAGTAAVHIAESLRAGRIDEPSLLAASFHRNQQAVRTFANQASLAPDLLWLVAELAVGPFAFVSQARLFAADAARAALGEWERGFCPACGSWPAFAEIAGGTRGLRCSFCDAAWRPPVCRCVYCAEEGPAFSMAAPDGDRPGWRLELCASCGGYLKSIETEAPVRYPLLAVDDMETLPLDVAAMEGGYGRPPLPELGSALAIPAAARPRLVPVDGDDSGAR
jgi:FdhE protein